MRFQSLGNNICVGSTRKPRQPELVPKPYTPNLKLRPWLDESDNMPGFRRSLSRALVGTFKGSIRVLLVTLSWLG